MSRSQDALSHLEWARQAEKEGNYLKARVEYLKCVESWKQANEDGEFSEEFEAATKEYQGFVERDPIYRNFLKQVSPVISSNPGILQKDIYLLLPAIGHSDISYVLYFADLQGRIRRVKKGRTYELYVS